MSPAIVAGQEGGTLEFRHRYLLESSRDGGVLEASRNGGAWFDVMNSAATVQAGDYNGTIASNSSSAIKGREAWTGSAAAFVTSRVQLPAAWAGESIVFRWRLVHNSGTTVTGWNVDDVTFTSSVPVADPFRPRLSIAASTSTLSESTPSSVAVLTLSTPLPLVQDVTVTLDVSGTAGAEDLSGTLPLTLVLPAGQTSVTTAISAVPDSLVEGTESLVFSIPSADTDFATAEPSAVTIEIGDTPVVEAMVYLSDLVSAYDGTGKSATATTDPAGLAVSLTYDGSAELPMDVGDHVVLATVTTPGYVGSATGTLVIVSAYTAWIETYADPEDPDAAASADLDGDGWDNAAEYAFGTLPDDPASRPDLQPVLTPESIRLMLPPAPPGIMRSVETSSDLLEWTGEGVTPIPGGYEIPRGPAQGFLRVVYEVVN